MPALPGSIPKTVTAGLDELDSGAEPLPAGRVRRRGAGRPRVEETDPGLVPALLELVEPARRGDPMTRLCWTSLSTRRLAAQLTAAGHWVSHTTVARLLKANGFSLQACAKTIEGSRTLTATPSSTTWPPRSPTTSAAGEPVISVDTKKKELVGAYKNNGGEWAPAGSPPKVNVHDFIGEGGKAIPYGVYDIGANTGWVSVGTSHDTAAFAVNTIRTWWNTVGRAAYPDATRLMITADGGGSNGYRVRAWKTELAALAAETGLAITVATSRRAPASGTRSSTGSSPTSR